MLDFGEGLTLENLSVPWLIWIQLLVLLLLLALLFGFSIIALDPSHHSIAPTASTIQQQQQQPSNYHSTAVTNRLQTTRVHPFPFLPFFFYPFGFLCFPTNKDVILLLWPLLLCFDLSNKAKGDTWEISPRNKSKISGFVLFLFS